MAKDASKDSIHNKPMERQETRRDASGVQKDMKKESTTPGSPAGKKDSRTEPQKPGMGKSH